MKENGAREKSNWTREKARNIQERQKSDITVLASDYESGGGESKG